MIVLPWVVTCLVIGGSAFCLVMFGQRLDQAVDELDLARQQLGEIKIWIAENFGGPDPIATVEAPQVDIVGGARKADVAAAREANQERPVPFPRARGRHSA